MNLTKKDRHSFWAGVDVAGPDECWLWKRARTGAGYGQLRVGGRSQRAHRVSWTIHNGPIPPGKGHHGTCILHACDNPPCVNPAHLRAGTNRDNAMDRESRGRGVHPKAERNGATTLSSADVDEIRQRYATGDVTQRALADEYGVSRSNIGRIVRRVNWKHRGAEEDATGWRGTQSELAGRPWVPVQGTANITGPSGGLLWRLSLACGHVVDRPSPRHRLNNPPKKARCSQCPVPVEALEVPDDQ